MGKKYELIESDIIGLHRIKALRDFGDVKKGDVGGYVENEYNLSHERDCWIYDNARVCGNARVYNNTKIYDNAKIYNNAKICDNAEVFEYAVIFDNAVIQGNALIYGDSVIEGNAEIKKGMHIGNINEKFKDVLYIQCEKRLITVYKDMNNIIKCNIGCQRKMTLSDLINRIKEDGGMNEHREEYVRIMKNAHLLFW